MKRTIIPIIILFSGGIFSAQITPSTGENYIYSRIYLSDPSVSGTPKTSETVQYFDGLGRPKQIISIKSSPAGKDLVTTIPYDQFGRQTDEWLPTPMSSLNGAIQSGVNGASQSFYNDTRPFLRNNIEASPLNRVLTHVQPGSAWQQHPRSFEYSINGDDVKKYIASFNYSTFQSSISLSGMYGKGQLYKNTSTDEDGNISIEYKDSEGQLVLVRRILESSTVDTYYVYNEYNQLAYVIPPLASLSGAVDQTTLDTLCYQYKYDNRNRLVEKKLPGKGWEYLVYDRQDRLVLSQDANMRKTNTALNNFGKRGWIFTKYDQFGRVVYTGFFNNGSSRDTMQSAINNMSSNAENTETRSTTPFTLNGLDVYYSKNAFPTGSMIILSVNYYDTYPPGSPAVPGQILSQDVIQETTGSGITTKGLPLASYIKNIDKDSWTRNYNWYDNKGRIIGTHSTNPFGGYTKTESLLDFAGITQQSITRHKRFSSDNERVITQSFQYDNQNRLLVHKHKIDNNTEEILTQNTYNEISQLQSKKVGGTVIGSGLQTIDYQYNIRGWMTQINDPGNLGNDLFGYKINYNSIEGQETPNTDFPDLKVKPRYNGNIAEVSWKTLTEENESLKRYGYVYDSLNRLQGGFYQKDDNPTAKEYFEKLDYDLNGNIRRLKRSEGLTASSSTALQIDNLNYSYEGNKLIKITDDQQNPSGYPYASNPNIIGYDNDSMEGNGNMISYPDKGISSIQYNFLNLPRQVVQNGKITRYIYRADGVKISKLFGDIETTYLDGFQYKSTKPSETASSGGGIAPAPDPNEVAEIKLRIIPTPEGYYDALLNQYVYNFTDHLGNVRLSYADTSKDGVVQPRQYHFQQCDGAWDPWNPPNCIDYWKPGEIIEVNNYYPFGLLHNYSVTTQNAYQYKYNGKELQESGMYDYGARFYMPDIGRWGVVDPLAEMMRRYSPYNYVFNNPANFVDPDGRAPTGGPGDGTDGKTIRTQDIEEVVITVRRKTQSFFNWAWNGIKSAFTSQYSPKTNADKYGGLNSYRQWQGSPFYNEGETKMDRMFRLMGNSKNEEMLNFGGGAYNMNGGYGRITNVSRAAKVTSTPELIFTDISPTMTLVHANNTQVGIIDYAASATTGVKIEINLSKDMQGMGIGSKIFSTAVEDTSAFEANWVKSSSLYPETGMSNNLIQYNTAIQKGASPTEAAWSTWSGGQAKANGFNSVNVQTMQNGIKATFTK